MGRTPPPGWTRRGGWIWAAGWVVGCVGSWVGLVTVSCDSVSGLSDFEIEAGSAAGGAGGSGGNGGSAQGGAGGAEPPLPCVLDVATRKTSSCAVTRDGRMWCWGTHGGLASGSTAATLIPEQAATSEVVQVGLGTDFVVALRRDGTVVTWGENMAGQLGNGESGSRQLVAQSVDIQDVVEIAVGKSHTCARTGAGAVRCWGSNDSGQLGLDPGVAAIEPAPYDVGIEAKRIAVGARHSCAIRAFDDSVMCWGRNDSGELGRPTGPDDYMPRALSIVAEDIALGGGHSCAVQNGNVLCWGWNLHWQLGGPGTSTAMPRQIAIDGMVVRVFAAGRQSCARLDTGAMWCWGESAQAIPTVPMDGMLSLPALDSELDGASAFGLGSYHRCALRSGGTLWCRGRGIEGQLGNGSITDSNLFVQVQLTCPDP